AHSVIGRGHRLVADAIVVLKRLSPQTLLGTHNDTNRELLALRSTGVMNVVRMYGRGAFMEEQRIATDVELTEWENDKVDNEIGMETTHTSYMDVEVPHIQIQIKPGRDTVGLIEAVVNNWHLQQQRYSAAKEFMKRIEEESNGEE